MAVNQKLLELLRSNPGIAQSLGAGQGTQEKPRGVADILQQAGAGGFATSGVVGKAAGQAIEETSPKGIQEQGARDLLLSSGFVPGGGTIGGVKFDKPLEQQLQEKTATETVTAQAKTASKLAEGQRASERSLSVVSTTLNDFSKTLVDAFDEGGFGDIIKATKTALKQKFAGGLATRQLSRTSEIPGKKVEIITKMMPLLTQQGDKPGSVRLVSTVFERLADSLPGANLRGDVRGNDISLEESRGMLSSTILSMLRFSQAIQSLGVTNEDVDQIPGKLTQNPDGSVSAEKGSELSKFGDLIERVSKQFFVDGSPEEQQIQDFISTALKPLDDKIALENSLAESETDLTGLTTEEQEELRLINEELAR